MLLNALIEGHELSTPMDTIYLDKSKAFDSFPHKIEVMVFGDPWEPVGLV